MPHLPPSVLDRVLPIRSWARVYSRQDLSRDGLAAVIVTVMLIPQSLAYAMLAGMPPEAGIYASILPIIAYALFGSSRVLAVGPVAVVSLMTAAALGEVAEAGTATYASAALTLAALSGAMLLAMGLMRMGFVANFLSHPVIAGFITASGILIAMGQLGPLLGIGVKGASLPELLDGIGGKITGLSWRTTLIGGLSLAFLTWVRRHMKATLRGAGAGPVLADALAKSGPVLAVVASTLAVWALEWQDAGVAVVGHVPAALPPFTLPGFSLALIRELALPALLISVVGFVESVSVAQTLAARKRQRIQPDQELIGLGAANLAAGFSGGFPVTGGFARSVVNADAGAVTPAAGIFTALGLAFAGLVLTPLLHFLPKATLAATIIIAVLGLVDLSILRRAFGYSRADFTAVAGTILVTLLFGVEAGISAGVLLSIGLHLWRSSRPHVAEVGLVAGTEHFRNILRHRVITDPAVVTLRIDESLYFANTRYLEELILQRSANAPGLRHVILMCSAVNEIDMTALDALEALNHHLRDRGISLNLSEVKGPVMDRLQRTSFLDQLTGSVFLSQHEAFRVLTTRAGEGLDARPGPRQSGGARGACDGPEFRSGRGLWPLGNGR
ncbi:SulP family inorganic anion transporter [Tabrizicola oligotrophica]|uniref:Sulfate permease n=1 Tax=Tabrizicola oligotrophica TaxID=2710650 RepID=A0A6M0QR81_9RHOB|nr:sulfate permease [Tabrizicola oligotrophica]NEY89957.1 sulfate permease [Tabrizicola oligotrophica]